MSTKVNNRQSPVLVEADDVPVLFHGTDVELQVGDLIVPGREVSKSRGQFVWLAPDDTTAMMWGSCTMRVHGGRTTYVYEVEPIGQVETCRSSYRAPRARVIRIVGAWW